MVEHLFCKEAAGGSSPSASSEFLSSDSSMLCGNLQEHIEARTAWVVREGISPERLRRMYWDRKLSVPEIARLVGVHRYTVYEWMQKFEIPRRDSRETSYLYYSKAKPQFRPKAELSTEDEKLKIAGVMLYWAEGAKRGKTVDFSNSDFEMIKLFMGFLRRICGVNESRLRAYLYHHGALAEVERSMRFWSQATGIPIRQFSKPYIRSGNPHRSGGIMEHGLFHIRYSDSRLLQLILQWIDEYTGYFTRAGTRVAKGASL